jgi:phenylacetic acid degradation operon negative regulatory protein
MTCTAGSALGVLQGGVVNARAAVFDLYGDHLRERGGEASISAIIRLLDALDIAAPAVRTAVSRMARQGWLEPVRRPSGPGYRLTNRAWRRLDEAAVRIFGK